MFITLLFLFVSDSMDKYINSRIKIIMYSDNARERAYSVSEVLTAVPFISDIKKRDAYCLLLFSALDSSINDNSKQEICNNLPRHVSADAPIDNMVHFLSEFSRSDDKSKNPNDKEGSGPERRTNKETASEAILTLHKKKQSKK